MKIDAHHHLWDLNAVHYPWLMAKGVRRFFGDPTPIQRNYPIEEFRADASACGFTGSVHVQVGAQDSLAEARWVQSVADANANWPAAQVAQCDLTADDLEDRLDALQSLASVRGVRQLVARSPEEDSADPDQTMLGDPRFVAGLHVLAERNLSFDLQIVPEIMDRAADILSELPNLKVALCHAGSPRTTDPELRATWMDGIGRLAALPSVFCKFSGYGMWNKSFGPDDLRPVAEACLGAFGPDRCMFGSNFPVDALASSYAHVVHAWEAVVPVADHDRVFGGTAADFYGINPS